MALSNLGSFCVLLPIYQRDDLERLFEEVIRTCFQGVVQPESIIIAIDGQLKTSFEEKLEKVKRNYPVEIVRSGERVGLSEVLNLGLTAVTSDYVFRVDGDDISRPERWALQLQKLRDGYALVGGHIQEVDELGVCVGKRLVPTQADEIRRFAKRRNPFNHMSVAFKADVARELGGYPHVFLKEDWAFWVEFISRGHLCANIDAILVDASAGVNMYQRRGGIKYVLSEWQMQILLVRKLKKNKFIAVMDFLLKISILLSPVFVKKIVYEYLLRSK